MRRIFDDPEIGRLFSQAEKQWIERNGPGLEELIAGERFPRDDAQRSFLAVAKGESEPSTDGERLWLRFHFARKALTQRDELSHLKQTVQDITGKDIGALISNLGPDLLASLGHSLLLRLCADHYLRGNSYDPEKALPLARRAADLGDGEAAYLLGLLYEYGLGCRENRVTAMTWYKKAAKRGVAAAEEKVKTLVLPDPSKPWVVVGNGARRVAPRGSGYDEWEPDELGPQPWELVMHDPATE